MLEPIFTPNVQQAVFRDLLRAQSFPGLPVAPTPSTHDLAVHRAVLAALLDGEVSLADPFHLLSAEEDWPFLEARKAEPEHADFILARGDTAMNLKPRLGTLAEPEKSATLVLVVQRLAGEGGLALRVSGPGVKSQREMRIQGLDAQWLRLRNDWNAAFPMGVDFILAGEDGMAALPRTTHVEVI